MNEDISPENINERFKGDKPLPCNVSITADFKCGTDQAERTFTQNILAYDDVPTNIRTVIDYVEEQALSSPDMPFREVAALIFIYKDNKAQAKVFTSDLPDHVNDDVHFNAIREARILDELDAGQMPRQIIHVHVHPGMEYKPEEKKDAGILINQGDFDGYQKLSAFFSHYAGQSIPLLGLVRPVGRDTGDVIIESEVLPHDPQNVMLIRSTMEKARRALAKMNP